MPKLVLMLAPMSSDIFVALQQTGTLAGLVSFAALTFCCMAKYCIGWCPCCVVCEAAITAPEATAEAAAAAAEAGDHKHVGAQHNKDAACHWSVLPVGQC
jgi:hypothetical protein